MIKLSSKPYSQNLVRFFGMIILLIGLVGLFYGPLEIYCFYMFSAGGKFYYDGFQIGSLWFAYLTIQNAPYYIVAFWGLLIYYGLMFISTVVTFSKYSLDSIITLMNLPQYEQQNMIPLLDTALNFNLTVLFGTFLIVILILIIYSRSYFFNNESINLKNK